MIRRPLGQRASLFRQLTSRLTHRLRTLLDGEPSLWTDEAAFAASLVDACDAVLDRALDPEFLRRQQARFGRGQALDAFAAQLLSTGEGTSAAHAVVELRFKGREIDQAFVELALLTPNALPHLAQWVSTALEAFAAARPGRVRVSVRASELEALSAAGLRIEPDLHCVAAPLRALSAAPGAAPGRLALRPIEDLAGSYARYLELCDGFRASCPLIARELYRSTREEFAAMVAHGKSFEVFCESRWAGLVAATPASLWGQPGWSVHEEFLSAEFRGRGMGLELQRALVQRLLGECGLLWGTIHAANQPSLSTALRIGRKVVQTHYWLRPAIERSLL